MAGCSRAPERRGPSWPLGEAGPQGLVAPAGPQGREGLQGPGPQGLIGERGGAGPPAHLAPSDRKARKARQGTRVGGTQWRTCPPGPQGAAGPPGPPGPERRPESTPIFRVVTETETLAARGASFWPALYARAAQSMQRRAIRLASERLTEQKNTAIQRAPITGARTG